MSLFGKIASAAGDTWANFHAVAIWPWPAVVIGLSHGSFSWFDYRNFCRLLQPGDIIITRSNPFFLSNNAIPGAFKHAAVYTGHVAGRLNTDTHNIETPTYLGVDQPHTGRPQRNIFERTVCHAISEGVVCQDVGDLLFHADCAMAVRPWTTTQEQQEIVSEAIRVVGRPYDFKFDQKNMDAVFCTELAAHCVEKAKIDPPQTVKIRAALFKPKMDVTLADYFTRYTPVVCSESCLDPAFQKRSSLGAVMRSSVLEAWENANK